MWFVAKEGMWCRIFGKKLRNVHLSGPYFVIFILNSCLACVHIQDSVRTNEPGFFSTHNGGIPPCSSVLVIITEANGSPKYTSIFKLARLKISLCIHKFKKNCCI